jgi:hypothetical protein
MPNLDLERYHLNRFLDAVSLIPTDEPVRTEAPDFLINLADRTIGVEHTEFYMPHLVGEPPPQMLHSLKNLAVEHARTLFRARGGPAVYVWVHMHSHGPRNKREAYALGEHFAGIVMRNGWATSVADGARSFDLWRDLPQISRYTILPSVDGVDELWTCGGGGWVGTVNPDHIQKALEAKAARYSNYIAKAPEIWLLLVNDEFRGGAPCEIGDSAQDAVYVHPFDRAFWYDTVRHSVVELRSARNSLTSG